ncbi:MAG TPA: hypothetical protein VFU55_12705 [Terracidiphilus sp.]|nr:hypothetical protein [Terracidiphilus sp.]
MNVRRNARLLFTVATLLATTAALAQSSAAKQKNTQPSDASHGSTVGRRTFHPFGAVSRNSTGSAHGTQSTNAQSNQAAPRGSISNAHTNPMYKDKGTSGNNPLYEGKDKTVQPSPHSGQQATHEVVEYKDGDDPVMHARNGSPSTARKSGSVIVHDKNGPQTAARKHGAIASADFNTKARAIQARPGSAQPAPHAAASTAKQ